MKKIWRYRYLYLMLLLPMTFYLVFCYWPMYGLQIAFKDYNIRARHYRKLLGRADFSIF